MQGSPAQEVYFRTLSLMTRFGSRARWTAAWVLILAWFLALILDAATGLANLLLVLGVALLLYALLAVDRPD